MHEELEAFYDGITEEHKKTTENESNPLIYFNRRSCAVDKRERRNSTEDTKDKNVVVLHQSAPRSSTFAVNTSFVSKSYKDNSFSYSQSFTEENEPVMKLGRVGEEYSKTNENESNRLTYLDRKSFAFDKHERRSSTEDTKEKELSNDKNVLVVHQSVPGVSTFAVNASFVSKSYNDISTNDTQFFSEENEPVMKLDQDVEEHNKTNEHKANHLTSFNGQSYVFDTDEQQCRAQDSKDENVPLNAQSNPNFSTPTGNTNILPKPPTGNSTNDTQSIVGKNEPVEEIDQDGEEDGIHDIEEIISTSTFAVNTYFVPKSYKDNSFSDSQSFTKENEPVMKLGRVGEEHSKTNENESNRLTYLNRKSFAVDKHEMRSSTEDTKEKELSNDKNVLVFHLSVPGSSAQDSKHIELINGENVPLTVQSNPNFSTPTGNTNILPKPPTGNLANDTQSIVEKNERVKEINQDGEEDEIHDIKEKISAPDIDVDNDNSQLIEATFPVFGFDDNFKTLEDALLHFSLYYCLERLDISLEHVRRRRITENEHEDCFKQIDKDILKLSRNYHPDTVQQRGGTENQINEAQKLQTTLNAVRAVLSYLNAAFLVDIRTDHKFKFYSKLNIRSLSNEKEVKGRIYEMKFKLCLISKIKQKNIILEIQKFLIQSKSCVSHYIQKKKEEFKKLCDSVFLQLNHCIEGFKKLCIELEEIEKACKEENNEHMLSSVQNMRNDSKRDLELLNLLEKSAKSAMKGNFEFFSTEEFIDPYFVLPFAWYINVILMCKLMSKSAKFLDIFIFRYFNPPKFNQFSELKPLYYLTAYYCGDNRYENKIKYILNNESFSRGWLNMDKCKTEIISKFREILIDVNENMEIRFNTDHYTEVMTADILGLEIEKCTSMMHDFEEQKQDLSKSIKEFRRKVEKMEKNYDDAEQTSKDLNNKTEEIAEANSKLEAMLAAKSSKIEELLKARKYSSENSQLLLDQM